jgi:enoyl-CoA hydratase
MSADVLFETLGAAGGALGLITLNRPHALNALNRGMCQAIHGQLQRWAQDSTIALVVIRGAGERAFCAGGDVVGLYHAGRANSPEWEGFFYDEYRMNYAIGTYPKPYIALLDGIFMGGGVGLSVHGRYRLVSEKSVFAMPETAIGLIPDVGGTYLLGHMPGGLGQYLALSGARLKAADCLYAGIATHFMSSAQQAALLEALSTSTCTDPQAVEALLARFAQEAGPASLPGKQAWIDHYFQEACLGDILAKLAQGDDEAQALYAQICNFSPTSLHLTFAAVRQGRQHDLAGCLTQEYRIVCALKGGHDFYEGIRAQLIDKDKSPRWQPAHITQVSSEDIARHFAPPASGDILFA